MIVHVVDGTYELFRQFYGQRRFNQGKDKPFGAVVGLLHSVLEMIEKGATHLGVATDHVIESFRNDLWPEYKTGEGIEPALLAQFHPLEDALAAMGVAVWPMIELEADDALVLIAPPGPARARALDVARAARAIGAEVLVLAREDDREAAALAGEIIALPDVDEALSPILAVVPLQLLAYHVAVARGRNPDLLRADDPAHARARAALAS